MVQDGDRFGGVVALVTGAGSGIGAAVVARLAEQGAVVVAADVDGVAVMRVAARVPGVEAESLDVTDPAAVDAVVERVMARHQRLDVVVHSAGVDDPDAKRAAAEAVEAGRPLSITADLPDAAWRRVLDVNLDGTFHVLRAAVRVMVPRGAGAVVAVGSSAAFDAPTGYPHYAASKAGVHALCQAVAKEVVGAGVRINVVAPGPTDTAMARRTPAALRGLIGTSAPPATAEEMADVVLFLAGPESGALAGAVLLANGARFTA